MIVLAAMSVGLAFSVVLRDPSDNRSDFYTFWDSARWLGAGLDPYTGRSLRPGAGYNLNPPVALLVFLPFSRLPLVQAYVVWTIVSVMACAVSAWVVAREVAPRGAVEIVAAVLISQATFLALQLGQPVGLLMGLLTAAWIADRRGALYAAGVLLGVAMAVKLFLGVFLFYAIWRRSGRLIGGIVSGCAATVAVGFVPAGMAGYSSWLFVLGRVTWAAHLVNGSVLGVLTRLLTTPPPGLTVTPLLSRPDLLRPLWLISVAAIASLAAWRATRTSDLNRVWLMTLAAALLCSPLGWIYYVPLAAGPLAAVAIDGSRSARTLIAIGYACCLVPFSLMAPYPLGRLATLTLGSAYFWGLVSWFAAGAWPTRPQAVRLRHSDTP